MSDGIVPIIIERIIPIDVSGCAHVARRDVDDFISHRDLQTNISGNVFPPRPPTLGLVHDHLVLGREVRLGLLHGDRVLGHVVLDWSTEVPPNSHAL